MATVLANRKQHRLDPEYQLNTQGLLCHLELTLAHTRARLQTNSHRDLHQLLERLDL